MSARSASGRPLAECAAVTLAAFALTWLAFAPAMHASFVSDDVNAIVENEWVTDPLDAAGILRNFSWWGAGRSDSADYRPAATLSFAWSRAMSGLDPSSFRIVNYVLNAICAGLLFALARALGLGREASGAAAAVFAVLPLHSEAVIWIVCRSELAAAAGFLIATLASLLYRRGGSVALLPAAAAAVAVGMSFKENVITVLAMPTVFHLAQRLGVPQPAARTEPSSDALGRDARATVSLATGAAVYLALRWMASAPVVPDAASLLDNPLSVVGVPTRLLGAVAVLGRYLALFFWPASLSVDYSYDALGIGPGFLASTDSLVALAFVAACVWAALRGRGRRDVVLVGLLLAAASYSIVSNTVFVLGTILGERLFYVPSAGLCIAMAALAEPVLANPAGRRGAVAAAVVCAIVATAIAVDRHRSLDWLTPVSLFEAAARNAPRSARAHMELASAYGNEGRIDAALPHFTAALAIKPDYATTAYNQGNVLARAGRYDEAVAAYRRALGIDAKLVRAWHNLALTERMRGNSAGWLDALKHAVAVAPTSAVLQSDLGEALLAAGRHEDAIKAYDAVVATGQAVAATYFNRGVARHHLGGCAAAVEDYRLAAAQPAAPREALLAASRCLQELGRDEEARSIDAAAKVANRDTRR